MALDPLASVEQLTYTLQRPNLPRDTAEVALERASGAIRGFTHWNISREVVTNQLLTVSSRTERLFLPTLMLVSVEAIVEGAVTLLPAPVGALPADYAWTEWGEVRRLNAFWLRGERLINVSYTHGYALDDYRMGTVVDVCIAAASRLVANPSGHGSEATGTESWTLPAHNKEVVATLTPPEELQLGPLVRDPLPT